MFAPMLSFTVLPLSWVGAKRRPTQFASNKNTPGTDYALLKKQRQEMLEASAKAEAEANTPGPEEVNNGDFACS
jgi:hypothetical protein